MAEWTLSGRGHRGPISANVLVNPVRCSHYPVMCASVSSPPQVTGEAPQAAVRQSTPATRSPPASRILTHSAAVAPVVTTSSTSSTVDGAQSNSPTVEGAPSDALTGVRSERLRIRPFRLSDLAWAPSPEASRTRPRTASNGATATGPAGRDPARSAARASTISRTWSKPLRRRARAAAGAGTNTVGRSPGSGSSPSARSSSSPAASAAPNGRARSDRPRSLYADTARDAGPEWPVSAHTGTRRSARVRTTSGGPARVASHPAHHRCPGRPQPAHSSGTTRSASAAAHDGPSLPVVRPDRGSGYTTSARDDRDGPDRRQPVDLPPVPLAGLRTRVQA